jgi:hypothetical protein
MRRLPISAAVTSLVLGLSACGGGGGVDTVTPAPLGDTIVVTESGQVASFNRATPGTQVGTRTIFGLQPGDTVAGIDFRPANGLLYALGSRGNLYTLDAATGRATLRSTLKAADGDDAPFTSLVGTQFGMDFNPVADRLRVVTNAGQNLRINVDTGDTITDGNLTRAGNPGQTLTVTAAAYTNAFRGATDTTLYVLDLTLGLRSVVNPPNNGVLTSDATLGVLGSGVNGFDLEARTTTGYAAIRVGNILSLYRIDLSAAANAATLLGGIGGVDTIAGLALVQPD